LTLAIFLTGGRFYRVAHFIISKIGLADGFSYRLQRSEFTSTILKF